MLISISPLGFVLISFSEVSRSSYASLMAPSVMVSGSNEIIDVMARRLPENYNRTAHACPPHRRSRKSMAAPSEISICPYL